MHDGGVHHPSTSTIGASAGAVSPVVENVSHTGAGFFIIDKHGWLAGAGSKNIWQYFGGKREGTESPWQTAARELLEETGIPAEHLVSLAPPFVMRKDIHIYVIHIAMVRSTHASSTFPMVTSRELTRFRHFTSFGDAFGSELGDNEMVHRRDIEPAFLQVAAEVYRAISMRAQAAPTTSSPRPASGGASVGASAAVSSTNDVSADDALLSYPLLHDSNYFDHEASGRKHARMLSNRVAREATWIDAVGQDKMNRKFTDNDSKRKRNSITRDMATSTRIRTVNDDVGHRLAGLPDNPPLTTVTVAAPTVLVPDEDKRWSFEFKDWSEDQVEQELSALQTAVDAAYSAPAVVNNETVLLSPPSGTSEPRLFASPPRCSTVKFRKHLLSRGVR
jgi:8-oxo-dGTP pyrophosphatase MutT (NUDIX family)